MYCVPTYTTAHKKLFLLFFDSKLAEIAHGTVVEICLIVVLVLLIIFSLMFMVNKQESKA